MNEGDGQQFTYTPTQQVEQHAVAPDNAQSESKDVPEFSPVRWQASEFIDHEKNGNWFLLLILAAIGVSGLTYLLSGSIFSTVVVMVAALAFAVTANQKPRTLQYSLQPTGIKVGEKQYRYDDFSSFSVLREGALWSIVLKPTKRFMPNLNIYFDPQDGEKIFDILATQMPHDQHQPDAVDRFMSRIRF